MTRKTYTGKDRIYYQFDKKLHKFRVWNYARPECFEYLSPENLAFLKARLYNLGVEIAEVNMVESFNAA